MDKIIILMILLSLLTLGVVFAIFKSITIKNYGTTKTLNLECDTPSINWGLLGPNETKIQIIKVRPTGNVPVTLIMNTSNWSPINASRYIVITWNYTNSVLEPNIWVSFELKLYILPTIEGIKTFNFDMNLIGVEAN